MSLLNMNGNVLCALDFETTGVLAGYNEIIQIACVPLDQHFEPHKTMRFHYINMKPEHPERASKEAEKKHGITMESLEGCPTQERGIEIFEDWYRNLNLPFGKRLIPLAHNFAFERGFMINWLGLDAYDAMWHIHPRDTFTLATAINDLYVWHGRVHPFHSVGLPSLCKRFDIQLDNAHDALADSLACAKLYAELMRFMGGC
jgi:DNA polymerase III epsilon subunit-like protein